MARRASSWARWSGEGYASALFSHLGHASPGFAGRHGTRGPGGTFPLPLGLEAPLGDAPRCQKPGGRAGRVLAGDRVGHRLGSLWDHDDPDSGVRQLSVRCRSAPPLARHFRSIASCPLRRSPGPARSFLRSVLLAAGLVALLVLGIAMIAADQFTKPIFPHSRCRMAARAQRAGAAAGGHHQRRIRGLGPVTSRSSPVRSPSIARDERP